IMDDRGIIPLLFTNKMDLIHTFYCTFLDKNSQSKFLCYTRRTKGTFNICLTDVSNVWSADCTEDTNLQKLRQEDLKSLNVLSACLRGDVSVVVGDTSAELCGGSSPGDPRLKLSRLEPPQAGEELKELLFTMADRLSQAEGSLSLATCFTATFHFSRTLAVDPTIPKDDVLSYYLPVSVTFASPSTLKMLQL
uniref:Uncharacterized protein n=1 Tax=Takifugu rubripes TaxID=31033 RepID=A0A674NEE5_TAKRU